jgi:hypothetical protein
MLEVLGALWRRRVLTLLGLVATVASVPLVAAHPPVYSTQADVVFLEPVTPQRPNVLTSATSGLIAMAGYVEKIVNAGVQEPATAENVTLLGRGTRDDYSIELPDSGGQWAHNFEKAVLNVQVTGPSDAVVRARLDTLVTRIRRVARDLQADAHVSAASTVHTDVSPSSPSVVPHGGNPPRAAAAAVLLGLGLTVTGVLGLDSLARRVGRRPRRRTSPRSVTA